MSRFYDEFALVVMGFGRELPKTLLGALTHLDPDFEHLTYGDQRAARRLAFLPFTERALRGRSDLITSNSWLGMNGLSK